MRQDHVQQMRREGYALIHELGRGGFATVYQAEQLRLHRQVAVKVLTVDLADPAALRRFERECESMGRLSAHPYVVDVLDARVSSGGLPFITMRLYQGSSLAHYINLRGPLTSDQALHMGRRMASALSAGHEMGIIHRDVKPENVLLDLQGESYLSDFGIAVLLDSDGAATTTAAFTRPHAAPEVLLDNEYGPRSDVYSLASTLHQTLTGRPPFVADTEGRQMMMVLRDPPPLIERADLQPGLQKAIVRGLEKDPARRWPSMAAFEHALQQIAETSPSGSSATTPAGALAPSAAPVTETPPRLGPSDATPFVQVLDEVSTAQPVRRRRRATAAWALPLALVASAAGVVGLLALLDRGEDTAASSGVAATSEDPTAIATEPGATLEAGSPVPAPAGPVTDALESRFQPGDCLDESFGVIDCSQPHKLQVTGLASSDRACITAGEDFVGRGATFTTRVVHDRVRGPEVDPALTGEMCVAGLVDRAQLQVFDFDLRGIVTDTLTSARLVGGCQADDRTADLGDARDLGPCRPDRPWLSGHSWRKGPIPADPPYCRTFSRLMDGSPYVAEPFAEPFDTAELWIKEVEREPDLQGDEDPSFFVPRIEVVLRGGEPETFEAATAQALPIPRPEDHPIHYRLVCGVQAY